MNTANPGIVIRNETDADIDAIAEVTMAAFATLEISHHTEQFIIEALRAAKALTVSLVAELDGRQNRGTPYIFSVDRKGAIHRTLRVRIFYLRGSRCSSW